MHHPKSTRNLDGLIRKCQSWKDTVAHAYADLGVVNSNMMDVYLVPFLSYWICVFVFLSEDLEFVHLEIFKIASIMATRRKTINLIVPVLARIYHGLNTIAFSTYAGSSDACFPVHYVYG